jgi:hypothetical protein
MLHCPNQTKPDHAEPKSNSFFVDAVVRVANDWLIRDYVEFLPNPYTCGDCGAGAFDDEEPGDPSLTSTPSSSRS